MIVVRDDLDLAAVDAAIGVYLVGGELCRLGMEAPAIACASAITPILIGSAASAAPDVINTAAAAVLSAIRNATESGFFILFSPLTGLL